MLLGTLGASLLRNLLTGKSTITTGEGIVRADQDCIMPHHSLTNSEIQK